MTGTTSPPPRVPGAAASTTAPNATQATLQSVAWIKYMAKGTMISPPNDYPVAFIPMTVARLRRNHLASKAAVLVKEEPLAAKADTSPNMKIRKRMWKVRLSRMVTRPAVSKTNRSPRAVIFRGSRLFSPPPKTGLP